MGAEPSGPPRPWFAGIGFGALVGGLTSVVSTAVVGRAWAACDIGTGAAANSMTLLLLAPLVWIVAALGWVTLHRTLGRRHQGAALAAGLVLGLWFTWFLATWVGMPNSCPASSCPDNVPPWWPSFIPA